MPPEASTSPSPRRELTVWLVSAAVAVAALLGAVVAMGGRIEAATWGLVVAAGAMVFALRSLYAMTAALSRPAVEAVLDQEGTAANVGQRELREERRRVLRAINELQFDYEMGKLSDEDYREVRAGYELRAVEVMRELDKDSSLHPELLAELGRRGLLEDGEAKAKADADEAEPEQSADEKAEAAAEESSDEQAEATAGESSDEKSEAAAEESSDERAEAKEVPAETETETETDGAEASNDEAESAAASTTCATCGGDNDADAKFCKHCGAKLGAEEASA